MKTLLDIPLDSICAKQRTAHKVTNLYKYTTQNTKENINRIKSFSFFCGGRIFPPHSSSPKEVSRRIQRGKGPGDRGMLHPGLFLMTFTVCLNYITQDHQPRGVTPYNGLDLDLPTKITN